MSHNHISKRVITLTPLEEANPLEAKIVVFTTVSPDVDASIRFYRDVIGMALADEDTLPCRTDNRTGRRQRLDAAMPSCRCRSSCALSAQVRECWKRPDDARRQSATPGCRDPWIRVCS